jgi:hypothetical protein
MPKPFQNKLNLQKTFELVKNIRTCKKQPNLEKFPTAKENLKQDKNVSGRA